MSSFNSTCILIFTDFVPANFSWKFQKSVSLQTYIEMIKPEKLDSTTTLTGLDYVEVPAMSSVDYKLSFYAYREGHYSAKVTSDSFDDQ